jgi:DNA-binding transcriptional MerR regulator
MSSSVSIQNVSERTGLSTYVIRAWERRYGILAPSRTLGGHRTFCEEDVQRLNLLAQAVRGGHPIGKVAALPNAELKKLITGDLPRPSPGKRTLANPAPRLARELLAAARRLDARAIDRLLEEGRAALGWQSLMEKVIAPAAVELGELWRSGKVTPMEEHFFSACVKVHLCARSSQIPRPRNAPRMVVGTPTGQLHELGAVMASAAAATLGWETAYMGPSLPSEEFVRAVHVFQAPVLTLSIVHPPDDAILHHDLSELVRLLPPDIRLIVGGACAHHYAPALQGRATFVDSIDNLCRELDAILSELPPNMTRPPGRPARSPALFS